MTQVIGRLFHFVKACSTHADIVNMKLSAEQAHLAYTYLHTKGRATVNAPLSGHAAPISPELVSRVLECLAGTPEISQGRVSEGLEMLGGSMPPAEAVAERILWRAYADSLR